MLTSRMAPMMLACMLSPRKKDNSAVAASSPSRALRSWCPSTAIALTRWVRMAFGPSRTSRASASALVSPSVELSSQPSTSETVAEETRSAANWSATRCGEQHLQCSGLGGSAEDVVGRFELIHCEAVRNHRRRVEVMAGDQSDQCRRRVRIHQPGGDGQVLDPDVLQVQGRRRTMDTDVGNMTAGPDHP